MRRMTVTLHQEEREALITLAERERRDPRQQAALCIRRELERRVPGRGDLAATLSRGHGCWFVRVVIRVDAPAPRP